MLFPLISPSSSLSDWVVRARDDPLAKHVNVRRGPLAVRRGYGLSARARGGAAGGTSSARMDRNNLEASFSSRRQ